MRLRGPARQPDEQWELILVVGQAAYEAETDEHHGSAAVRRAHRSHDSDAVAGGLTMGVYSASWRIKLLPSLYLPREDDL